MVKRFHKKCILIHTHLSNSYFSELVSHASQVWSPSMAVWTIRHCHKNTHAKNFAVVRILTILAIHGVKMTKNQTPQTCFALLFYNQTVFQKFERPIFEQGVYVARFVLRFNMSTVEAELKCYISQYGGCFSL